MFPGVLGNFEGSVAEWPSEIASPVFLDGFNVRLLTFTDLLLP